MSEIILIIRTSGAEEKVELRNESLLYDLLHVELKAECLCTVNLHDGRFMYVDDLGYETEAVEQPYGIELRATKARKPVNKKATELYHSVCVPGTTHQIVGDVAIVEGV